jgi:hypothetical protein
MCDFKIAHKAWSELSKTNGHKAMKKELTAISKLLSTKRIVIQSWMQKQDNAMIKANVN